MSNAKVEKFIVNFCSLLKNRTTGQFVCNLCLKDINKNRIPKRSKINLFKFSQFPSSFVEDLKKHCVSKGSPWEHEADGSEHTYEGSFVQLNRLESFLLKLVIPFVRVAHCPRGPYLKVKGDLILISSNLEHSLSQILPLEQNFIPVSFKRKLAYSGSFIEEIVERKKNSAHY